MSTTSPNSWPCFFIASWIEMFSWYAVEMVSWVLKFMPGLLTSIGDSSHACQVPPSLEGG